MSESMSSKDYSKQKREEEKIVSLTEKGKEAYRSGDVEKARRLFIKVIQIRANDNIANYYLGRIAKDVGRIEEAKERFVSLLDSVDTYRRIQAAISLSDIYIEQNGAETAVNWLELYRQDMKYSMDEDAKILLDLEFGKRLLNVDKERAEDVFKKVISETTNSTVEDKMKITNRFKAMRALSRLYLLEWRDDEAIEMCVQTLENFERINEQEVERKFSLETVIRELATLYRRNLRYDELNALLQKYEDIPGLRQQFQLDEQGKVSEKSTIETLREMYFSIIDGEQLGRELDAIIFPSQENGGNTRTHASSTLSESIIDDRKYSETLSPIKRLEKFGSYKPTAMRRGQDNFEGYIMFEYENLGIIILEKFLEKKKNRVVDSYGAATYIIPMDLEIDVTASSRTEIKAMRDQDSLKIATLSHTGSYYDRLDDLISSIEVNGSNAIEDFNRKKIKRRIATSKSDNGIKKDSVEVKDGSESSQLKIEQSELQQDEEIEDIQSDDTTVVATGQSSEKVELCNQLEETRRLLAEASEMEDQLKKKIALLRQKSQKNEKSTQNRNGEHS